MTARENSAGSERESLGSPTAYRRRLLTARDAVGYVVVLLAALLLLVGLERVGIELPYLRPVVAVALLSVGPGLLLLVLAGVREQTALSLLLYAVGLSLMTAIAIGVGISLLYPAVGVARPIAEIPLLATFTGLILLLAAAATLARDGTDVVATLPSTVPANAVLVFLTLPFLAIIAISVLDRFGTNVGAIVFLALLSLVPLVALTRYVDSQLYPLAVWVSALSVLYFKSLWSGSYPIEMWMHQMVLEQGRWVPVIGGDITALPDIRGMGQEGVLVDAVLYPVYSLVADVEMMTQLEVVNPLFVSLIPLGMYETYRRYVADGDALLATFIFVFTYRFYAQHYPNAPRDVMATLFLVLIALLVADTRLTRRTSRALALVFAVGIAVSHYGAAYLFVGALCFAFAGVVGLRLWQHKPWRSPRTFGVPTVRSAITVVDPVFVGFVGAFVMAWYLYTGGSLKFDILVETITDLASITEVSGLASERVLSDKPLSVEMTRNLIVVGFGLMGLGAATEGLRKLFGDSSAVDDEYLFLAVGMVGVFALTFTGIGTGFGQGRILMLSLSLGSLFIVLAPYNLRELGRLLGTRSGAARRLHEGITKHITAPRIQTLLAAYLCVFLLFNTGVVAETVTRGEDYGPSLIVNNERLAHSENPARRIQSKGCIECDIQTHVWTLNHGVDGASVYDGGLSNEYYWYGHSMVAQVDDFVDGLLLTNRSTLHQSELPSEWSSVESGSYILLTEDNYDSGWVFASTDEPRSLRSVEASLNESDRVYTSGRSTVYRYHDGNSTAASSDRG